MHPASSLTRITETGGFVVCDIFRHDKECTMFSHVNNSPAFTKVGRKYSIKTFTTPCVKITCTALAAFSAHSGLNIVSDY